MDYIWLSRAYSALCRGINLLRAPSLGRRNVKVPTGCNRALAGKYSEARARSNYEGQEVVER